MDPGHRLPGRAWTAELLARQAELRRFARRLAADAHLAEDLLQELNLLALDPRRAPVEAPFAWMKGVLRHLFRGELRGTERRLRLERRAARALELPSEACGEPDGAKPEGGRTRPELERVLRSLERLREPYRSTLVLRFVEGRTPAQTAAALGVPLRTVHTRTTRGLALLRRTLARGEARAGIAWPAGALSALAGLAAAVLFVIPTHEPPRASPASGSHGAPVSEYELLILPDSILPDRGAAPWDHARGAEASLAADPAGQARASERAPDPGPEPSATDARG